MKKNTRWVGLDVHVETTAVRWPTTTDGAVSRNDSESSGRRSARDEELENRGTRRKYSPASSPSHLAWLHPRSEGGNRGSSPRANCATATGACAQASFRRGLTVQIRGTLAIILFQALRRGS
jgi:hypothetical protein